MASIKCGWLLFFVSSHPCSKDSFSICSSFPPSTNTNTQNSKFNLKSCSMEGPLLINNSNLFASFIFAFFFFFLNIQELQATFRQTLTESAYVLKSQATFLGSKCIDRARPYYNAVLKAKQVWTFWLSSTIIKPEYSMWSVVILLV